MVKRHYFSHWFLVLAGILFFSSASAANITVKVDRDPIQLNESFHLVYEADSNVDDPDFSILYKDFDVLNSSQSTNMRSVNGDWSLKKSWDLSLISKQAGVFTIPPIPFGNDTSPSLRITVKDSPSASAPKHPGDPGADVFIEVETDVKQAWLQSQIIYTIRLFSNVPVGRPTLSQPETDDADTIFFKLGDVKNYEAFRQGERYAVSELKFAAFAQHSGTLTFKPVLFEGLITNGRPRSLFDSFAQRGTMKRLRSKPISVTIKPIPAGQKSAQWLPASQLTLVEEWSGDVHNLAAGEPVTRTITLSAKGLTAEQLPDIKEKDIDGLKQYPDQATLNNDNSDQGATGTRVMKMALIPTHSGDYQLPEFNIPWWNTRTGKAEVATLPATRLHVTGVANTLANPPPVKPTIVPSSTQSSAPANASGSNLLQAQQVRPWQWLSLGLALVWLATLILWWRSRRQQSRPLKSVSLASRSRAVQKAALANQPGATREALLAWAAARWPDATIANLADIAQRCEGELGETIRTLNSSLYSAAAGSWQGQPLVDAFKRYRSDAASPDESVKNSTLEPLYK